MEINTNRKLNILMAAGGTGGHLFPAIAVAEQLKKLTDNNINIQFIGSHDRMESKLVPEMGYTYHSMKISGYAGISVRSLALPWRILNSVIKARAIIKVREIDAVIAAGAYISYPPGMAAIQLGVPLFLMESNVNPGKANAKLAPKAVRIFTAFEESEKYFEENQKEKLVPTGNPVRSFLLNLPAKDVAMENLELDKNKKTLLIMGGSLGARSINTVIDDNLKALGKLDWQIIWQTGSNYIVKNKIPDNIKQMAFINDMSSAYSAADFVVCRSGATTIAELMVVGKPSILIPMPSASNNEQYYNAKVLADRNAAILIEDSNIASELKERLSTTLGDNNLKTEMANNLKELAKPDAAERVAQNILDFFYKED
jgi:UDP-N-acetylglucosamine--N-acetylmuramyl-(pentapeptide) pyrophosphoryl-undecaprenol N-acetylglucosamine transferase